MRSGVFFCLRRSALATVSVFALCVGSHVAMAQLQNATGIADPSRAQEQLEPQKGGTSISPDVKVNAAPAQDAPAGAENIKFTLNAINVEGATVYRPEDLRKIYAQQIGSTITLADLYRIAVKVTGKYRNDGYILTQVVVPPQEIEGGTATLRVVEGYIDQVKIEKTNPDMPVNTAMIESYAARIGAGAGPLNIRSLERELLIIGDLPGLSAKSVLSPSPKTPGAADLLIVLDYSPVDAILNVDNFGSRYLGPTQYGAGATMNSLLGLNEAISAQIALAPQSWYELAYGALTYEQPLGNMGTKIHFSASATDTDPGWNLAQFDVKGRSYLLNVGMTHPFIRTRAENLTARVNFDWRRVRSSNNVEETRRDRLSVLRTGLRYEFMDTLLGAAANTFDGEVSKGLGIFGASEEGSAHMTRDAADPQFTKFEGQIQRLQRITTGVNLLLSGNGQIASNALLASEEFGVGGITNGRGYDPSEIVGDHGISGRVELQWNDPYKINPSYVDSYQLYGFYDVGRVWNEDATTGSQKRDSLASTGVGVKLDLPYEVNAGLAIAVPLTREVQTENDKDPKVYFNLSKKF